MSEALTIRKLIDRVTSGDIRIPAFQRDFVWEPDQVAFLLDSIYKKFPIGTVIFWKTDNRLTSEKDLGRFTLPEPRRDYPVNYVLDGQQRITSLFSVFQTELIPNEGRWVDIYFDLKAIENVQESIFLALASSEVDISRHFPVNVLFDTIKYRKSTASLDDELVRKVDALQERFKEYIIPNETFVSDDRNNVAIVFERINRAGTELNVFQLLSAWSWSEDFDLTEKFEELQNDIVEHEYDELCKDQDLQLRICSGVINGETTPAKILELQGQDIRNSFKRIRNGIIGAIDFLRRELNIASYRLLPFPGLLVPLSVFFATDKPEGINYTDKQKQKLIKWFWRSIFSRRFSAGVNDKQASDIVQMKALRENEDYHFLFPQKEISFNFSDVSFSVTSANTKSFIILLSQFSPYSFLSGAKIDLSKVLQKINKNEFHHIFPKKFLEKQGFSGKEINVLANICFLTRGDNNKIKDKAPSIYAQEISQDNKSKYLQNALCPEDFDELDYKEFLVKRSKIIRDKVMKLIE
jgi:hypothetical protein